MLNISTVCLFGAVKELKPLKRTVGTFEPTVGTFEYTVEAHTF